jgi:hypothetical protein
MRDGGGWKIEGMEREPVRSIYFHAASMTEGGGQKLSKAKNKSAWKNQRRERPCRNFACIWRRLGA